LLTVDSWLDVDSWKGQFWAAEGWAAADGGTAEVLEPATGTPLTSTGVAGPTDVDRAVVAAARAQEAWAAAPPAERAAVLRRAARLIEDATDQIVPWIVRETGGTVPKAHFEISLALANFHEASGMPTQPPGVVLPSTPDRESFAKRVPHGVVGVISPWNAPFILSARSLAPAIAVGNAVVLKPDVQTPVCGGFILAQALTAAGLPAGVLQVLPGGAEAGEALVNHPGVAMISFTGSSAVGRRVGELAGRGLKKVSLELGGNNAYIVLADADVPAAASAGAFGSFLHQGQICMASGRHLVHESVAEEYAAVLAEKAGRLPVGDPHTGDVVIGPLINERQLKRVDALVQDSVAAGARVRVGARFDGPFYYPTVLDRVLPEMAVFAQEIFGPVAPITTFRDDDEAIALANMTEYGLSAAVQTSDLDRGTRIAERLRSGVVHVNDQTINDEAWIPFGGVGASGNGSRFGAPANWDAFTSWRWYTRRATPAPYPF